MADKQEKDLIGGTPKKLRGINANDESISSTIEDVFNTLIPIVDFIELGIGDTSKEFSIAYGAFILSETKSIGSTIIVLSTFNRPVSLFGNVDSIWATVDTPMKISIIQNGAIIVFVNKTNSIVHLQVKWISR